jgi:hypothetical protein
VQRDGLGCTACSGSIGTASHTSPRKTPSSLFLVDGAVLCVCTLYVCVRLSWGLSRDHFIVW